MEDVEQQQPLAAGTPAQPHQFLVKLPGFWTEDPVPWFRLVEEQFALCNVVDLVAHYYHVLVSLSQDAMCLIHQVLHMETGPDYYINFCTSLLASHSLSNYQKMEMMRLQPLGDRKPSVMLVEMLEYCPAGESTTAVFTYLFLQRLPREIRVLMSEENPANKRAIVDKVDRLACPAGPRCLCRRCR